MNLTPIIFKNVGHLIAEIKKHLDPKFKYSTRRIVAAILSLWRWEQYPRDAMKCALCSEHHDRKGNCDSCPLTEFSLHCFLRDSLFRKALHPDNEIQPLIDALEKAVLYEVASVAEDMFMETTKRILAEELKYEV